MASVDFRQMVADNRAGRRAGLPSFCTANEAVLDVIVGHAAAHGLPVLIEATCHQANQFGGYTGMQPADFVALVRRLAAARGLPPEALILGGDHLGPNPWRDRPVAEAMGLARDLVRLYVEAGFSKIHLDASMACGGEPAPSFDTVAERAAELCRVAEAHAPDPARLSYVIGTEVPAPGGEREDAGGLDITSPERLARTVETHRAAFAAAGLDAAWERVVSVVTQPGVDHGLNEVYHFVPERVEGLVAAILDHPGLSFEAHATDYQTGAALAALVERHFLFLKVGPSLTFAYREAVLAAAHIEARMDVAEPSQVETVVLEEMERNPAHWQAYYQGTGEELARLKLFSLSDRIRYYWTVPRVAEAVARLGRNLSGRVPPGLISQYAPGVDWQAAGLFDAVIRQRVGAVVARYYAACGV
jgi:D-tagatose-1,6-bisphosphate aldolase subunit GatZ/KbaZ